MKLVQINVVCNGSTGNIMCDIAKTAQKKEFETYCFYGRGNANNSVNCIRIGNMFSVYFHILLARLGFNGYGSYFATKKLIKSLKQINPDVIHLHNIHGYYLNLNVLFKYLKGEYKGKIIWTLHDCWALTGHCAHFVLSKCDKWKTECQKCKNLFCYPKTIFDTTKMEHRHKKELFFNLNNLTLITPSHWLEEKVKESFLGNYKIKVINNGIDTNVFRKHDVSEVFFEKHPELNDKKIILGVANVWEESKGLKYFIDLCKKIDSEYKIVLVGLNEQQLTILPKEIVGIKRTESKQELADLYCASHLFYNPSFEETFSLVTAEAMNCGLPVIVFDASAPKELVSKKDYIVKDCLNKEVSEVNAEVISYLKKLIKSTDSSEKFPKNKMVEEYLKIYK